MKSLLSKYSYLIIWIVVLVAVGLGFVFIIEQSLHAGSLGSKDDLVASTTSASAVAPSSMPSVNLTIVKIKTGNSLYVQWANLPLGTTALNIFRGPANGTSSWSLWDTVSLTVNQLANGSTSIDLGNPTLTGYSYYVEAISTAASGAGNETGMSGGSASSSTVLWTSSVTEPTASTSIPADTTGDNGNGPPSTLTSTPSSTPPAPEASSSSSPSSTMVSTGTPPTTSSGTAYYNPEVQAQGYISGQSNNFWVQYSNNFIEIGWQNLPPGADDVIILRSPEQNGPWSTIFTQQAPAVNTAYSIQLVDDTLGAPYYYEMETMQGSTTIATYGPVYLAGGAQE